MDVHPTKNGIFIGIDPYPYMPGYVRTWIANCHMDDLADVALFFSELPNSTTRRRGGCLAWNPPTNKERNGLQAMKMGLEEIGATSCTSGPQVSYNSYSTKPLVAGNCSMSCESKKDAFGMRLKPLSLWASNHCHFMSRGCCVRRIHAAYYSRWIQ
jgi:hypothetical protein